MKTHIRTRLRRLEQTQVDEPAEDSLMAYISRLTAGKKLGLVMSLPRPPDAEVRMTALHPSESDIEIRSESDG